MSTFFLIASIIIIVLSLLPLSKNQHWIFRLPEFMKLQILLLQVVTIVGLLIYGTINLLFWMVLIVQIALMGYHFFIIWPYFGFFKTKKTKKASSVCIKILSCNVYQFNTDFERFKQLVKKEAPDIFITIESNTDWEVALKNLETDYPYSEKNPLENTYGIHLYSKIAFEKITTHYFVSNDLPSIEAHFKTQEGEDFVVFAVHPPPPSPTEEETSKERDGDLLSIAKRVRKIKKPTIVIGDFNTVAWSTISSLFRKNSKLIDARKGRGILASFHAKYWFFRVPLDLVFHSFNVFVKELKVLENVGSDHFPIRCIFYVNHNNDTQKGKIEPLNDDEKEETEELIEEGQKEESDNRIEDQFRITKLAFIQLFTLKYQLSLII